jgi:hypothetical protein
MVVQGDPISLLVEDEVWVFLQSMITKISTARELSLFMSQKEAPEQTTHTLRYGTAMKEIAIDLINSHMEITIVILVVLLVAIFAIFLWGFSIRLKT